VEEPLAFGHFDHSPLKRRASNALTPFDITTDRGAVNCMRGPHHRERTSGRIDDKVAGLSDGGD
jgi:hypothetical protein